MKASNAWKSIVSAFTGETKSKKRFLEEQKRKEQERIERSRIAWAKWHTNQKIAKDAIFMNRVNKRRKANAMRKRSRRINMRKSRGLSRIS